MNNLLTVALGLFAIVNPFGAIPVFVSMTKNDSYAWKRTQALRGSLGMMVILTIFLLLGSYILNFFSISISGIRIAGGLIIAKYGYDLYSKNSDDEPELDASVQGDISFSPLAMPMLSGPGSISFVIGVAAQGGLSSIVTGVGGIAVVGVLTFLLLASAPLLVRYMGKGLMEKISKVAGFITMAVGVQMVLSGLSEFYLPGVV